MDKLVKLIDQSPISITTPIFEFVNERMMKGTNLGHLKENINKELKNEKTNLK